MKKFITLFLILISISSINNLEAAIEIEIDQAIYTDRLKLLLVNKNKNRQTQQIYSQFNKAIIRDLNFSNLVTVKLSKDNTTLDLNTDNIIHLEIQKTPQGYIVKYSLMSNFSEAKIINKQAKFSEQHIHYVAHKIAKEIIYNLTYRNINFNNKILFTEDKYNKDSKKKLWVSNISGDTPRQVLELESMILTPKYHFLNPNIIFFTAYTNTHKLKTHIYDLEINKISILNNDVPVNQFSPTISKNFHYLINSFFENGETNLLMTDITNGEIYKLTDSGFIDTEATFTTNDSNKLLFISDSSGKPAIYLLDFENNNSVTKISVDHRATYSNPAWSPSGRYISFTKQYKNSFNIGIIDLHNPRKEHIFKTKDKDEAAKWLPEGNGLIFNRTLFSENDKSTYIYVRYLKEDLSSLQEHTIRRGIFYDISR